MLINYLIGEGQRLLKGKKMKMIRQDEGVP